MNPEFSKIEKHTSAKYFVYMSKNTVVVFCKTIQSRDFSELFLQNSTDGFDIVYMQCAVFSVDGVLIRIIKYAITNKRSHATVAIILYKHGCACGPESQPPSSYIYDRGVKKERKKK